MTLHRANYAPVEPSELLGDLHPLIEQLGSLEGLLTLSSLSAALRLPPVDDRSSLELFLQAYQSNLLLPVELPSIQRAYAHTTQHEIRELIALDCRLGDEAGLTPFANASRRIGRSQLARLRPLRDQRVVQRYLKAVDMGEAHGWHILVYGLTMAIYSIPLRQGLLNYGRQTLRGFIQAAASALQVSEEETFDLLERISAPLPSAVERLLNPSLAPTPIH